MPSHIPSALEVNGVIKSYGSLKAVNNVNLTIPQGTFLSLIGPNGAGKSTLLKMIVGLLRQDKGSIRVFGKDTLSEGIQTKGYISYISDEPTPYEYLTGEEFIALTARLRAVADTKVREYQKYYVEAFGLHDIIRQRISEYSRGSKQKVAFIAAMVHTPQLLIIDEPVVGLDPTSIETFGKELQTYVKKGGTVLLATHILSFAADYAQTVAVLHKGSIQKEQHITSKTDLNSIYELATRS